MTDNNNIIPQQPTEDFNIITNKLHVFISEVQSYLDKLPPKIQNTESIKTISEMIKTNLYNVQDSLAKLQTMNGGGKVKGRKVHVGPNGGKYVVKNGKKVYMR